MPFRPLPTHLLDSSVNAGGLTTARALCGTWNPRRASPALQAVSCPKCIDAVDLAPA